MTRRLILAEAGERSLRVALLVDGRLAALEIDRMDRPGRVGAVELTKVIRIMRGLGALLKLADGTEMLLDHDRRSPVPTAGERFPVQILREQRGAKLGIASREIKLAGRGLIHLPFGEAIAFSRRQELPAERRANLADSLAHRAGGWIVRRTAQAMSEFEIMREANALADEGGGLAAVEGKLPAPDAFRRLMSDHGAPAPESILVFGRGAERAMARWCDAFAPDLQVRVEHQGPGLFDAFDLDAFIAALAESRVPLDYGASLVIERTEALTAIDVNAGGASNAVAVNLMAAREIARQLLLRHIGGIVVIDFISMERAGNGARIAAALKEAVADDPARIDILPMSKFGLIEMTRERRGPELELSA